MENDDLKIININSTSGKQYALNKLVPGEYQYEDRHYQFNYIPDALKGCSHIKTHGNDKLINENDVCLTFEVNHPVNVFVLYADKFPVLPKWLGEYERTRYNITREDSTPGTLRGYFSLYKKQFVKGKITLFGCSQKAMLDEEWFVNSGGMNYYMYTIAVKKI